MFDDAVCAGSAADDFATCVVVTGDGSVQQDQTALRELMPFGGRLRARGAIVTGPDGKN